MAGTGYTIIPPGADEGGGGYSIEPPDPSVLDRTLATGAALGHGAGLNTRGLIQNALALPMLPVNFGIELGNLVNRGVIDPIRERFGLDDRSARYPSMSTTLDQFLTKLGVAEPQTPTERVATDVVGAVTGTGTIAKAAEKYGPELATKVEQLIAQRMAQSPGGQAVAGGSGALASSTTREAGGGPVSQLAAGLIGSLAPAGIPAVGAATARFGMRGGEAGRAQYADRLAAFEDANVSPSAGQASGGFGLQTVESTLARTPGAAGKMREQATGEAADMGAKVNAIADEYFPPGANTEKAGYTIKQGLDKFVERFKGGQEFLYQKLDALMPKGTRVTLDNTMQALANLNQKIPGAPTVSRRFINSTIQGIEDDLAADLAASPDGKLPWEALTKLRTQVGQELNDHSLASEVPRSKYDALYAALSEDMRGAAQQVGPDASQALNRAVDYTRGGHQRIGGILDKVKGGQATTAEQIYQAATGSAQQGGTTIGTVLRSLLPEERKAVTAAFIKRMGLATPGQQSAEGDVFSSQTFLTNWNKVSPQAKTVLFPDQELRQSLDQVAKAAEMIKQGSNVFANPSGTTGAYAAGGFGAGIVGSVLTGHLGTAATLIGTLLTAKGAAHLLTNPTFVKWLAKSTTMPAEIVPAQVNQITQYANKHWSQEDQAALADYVSGLGPAGLAGAGTGRAGSR